MKSALEFLVKCLAGGVIVVHCYVLWLLILHITLILQIVAN